MKKHSKEVLRRQKESHDSNKKIGATVCVEETKLNVENTETALDSSENKSDTHRSGHSTPIRSNASVSNVERSPVLEYLCSPILLPCTQEATDEVVWDWHSSLTKSSDEKDDDCKTLCGTPKRSNLLQKRRAAKSNSPLLYKPIKRKLIQSKNIENIEKFTAELKALADQIKKPQKQEDDLLLLEVNDVKDELDNQLFIEMNVEKEEEPRVRLQVIAEEKKLDTENSCRRLIDKVDSSFEDLFDDSIDDCMIRCSQEVEERLNLGPSTTENLPVVKSSSSGERWSSLFYNNFEYVTALEDTNENNSNQSNANVGTTVKRSLIASHSNVERLKKSNLTVNKCAKVSSVSNNAAECSESLLGNTETEIGGRVFVPSQIPDDSFDDCCLEVDEKLMCRALEDEEIHIVTNQTHNRYGKVYKNSNVTVQKMNKEKRCDGTTLKVPDGSTQSVAADLNVNVEMSRNDNICNIIGDNSSFKDSSTTTTLLEVSNAENRKFFKLRSFSDSYFPNKKTASNIKYNASTALQSRTILKSSSNSNLNSKGWNKSISRADAGSSVSTKFSSIQNVNLCHNNNHVSLNSNDHGEGFNINRLLRKGGSTCNYKRKTDTKIYHTKEARNNSQLMECTPEEIERKRLEAKMKLEAKKKTKLNLQTLNASSGILVRKAMKR